MLSIEQVKADLATVRREKTDAIDVGDFVRAAQKRARENELSAELFERTVEVRIKIGATSLRVLSNLDLPEPDLTDFHGHHEWLSRSEVVVHYPPTQPYYEAVERARRWLLRVAREADVELALKL